MNRAAAFGAIVGFLVAAASLFLRGESSDIYTGDLAGKLLFSALLFLPAGAGAFFAFALGAIAARFGIYRVAAGLFVINIIGSPYTAWRRGEAIAAALPAGIAWGLATAAFVFVAGWLVARDPNVRRQISQ